jgi:hypothetical protein
VVDAFAPPYAFRRESLEPSIIVPDDADERHKRVAGAAIALACAGTLDASEAGRMLMLPLDDVRQARLYLPKKSTCALFARGYLRLVGGDHDVLFRPYLPRDGQAVADVVRIARDAGVWRVATAPPVGASAVGVGGGLPDPGDVVLIGRALPDGRPDPAWVRGTKAIEHVLVATRVRGHLLDSVDGGQPNIAARTRQIVRAGRELWLGDTRYGVAPDGRPAVGRRVVGWLSLVDYPTPRDAYVPESYAPLREGEREARERARQGGDGAA